MIFGVTHHKSECSGTCELDSSHRFLVRPRFVFCEVSVKETHKLVFFSCVYRFSCVSPVFVRDLSRTNQRSIIFPRTIPAERPPADQRCSRERVSKPVSRSLPRDTGERTNRQSNNSSHIFFRDLCVDLLRSLSSPSTPIRPRPCPRESRRPEYIRPPLPRANDLRSGHIGDSAGANSSLN